MRILMIVITVFLITSTYSQKPKPPKEMKPSSDKQTDGSQEEAIPVTIPTKPRTTLCDEPVTINSANRFPNSTVRLYWNDKSWDLMSLPDKQGFVTGETTINIPGLAPVKRNASIVTVLEGAKKGITYKFEKQFFWTWDENGNQVSGGKGGEYWEKLPKRGFNALFHNSNATNPMFIAFKDGKVFYLSTKENEIDYIGKPDGHIGGKFGEKFPVGIQAAFTWLSDNTMTVYLFKEDKYCLRSLLPLKSGKDCDQWFDNKELFGCVKGRGFDASVVDNTTSSGNGTGDTETSSDVGGNPDNPIDSVTSSDSDIPSNGGGEPSGEPGGGNSGGDNVEPVVVVTSKPPTSGVLKPIDGFISFFTSILLIISILYII